MCLVVMDGWGIAPPGPSNAISLARTPVFDELWATYPHAELSAGGASVGLPDGFEHLHALIALAGSLGVPDLVLHCFTDGRDTPPTAGEGYRGKALAPKRDFPSVPSSSISALSSAR